MDAKDRRYRFGMNVFVFAFVFMWVLVFLTACSTVTGAGRFMQGIGQDLEDIGEGTRERMGARR